MENAEIEKMPQINLDARPSITKISFTLKVIGPYVRFIYQGSFADMAGVIDDLKKNQDVASRLEQAIRDMFFFSSQPVDKILDNYFPENKTRIKRVSEKKRHYKNDYITITEELK